jgi:hypothetical protein
MKVVHLDEGHNFHVDWHSNFEWKSLENWLQGRIHCSKEQAHIQSWHWCNSKSVEKNPL